ncbi:MAG: hypothetical protein CVU05_01915 [Bacteroidetes bacterium HGW-Bacteroidetes-21]|nr:MAG: hypothetical protein CVU05_01915 [Bacteroidetes bacterium HGW-Bacteroidetes-21]
MKRIEYFSIINLIIVIGIIARLIIIFFFAEAYYNRPNIYVDGDTQAWAISFQNLVQTGSFTVNPDHEYGYFGRMPGYSFFLGFFWLILGKWESVYPVIAYIQIFLDVVSIWLIYRIAIGIFNNKSVALTSSFLYALYPFVIVWNPVVYSESASVFLMLLSLFFLLKNPTKDYFLAGIFLGIGILFRPQLMFLVPIFALTIIAIKRKFFSTSLIYFTIALIISYGIWPIRNLINHNKIVLTQDLRGIKNWNVDVISFMQYTFSVKSDWEPQFTSIIKNTPTQWPSEAYVSKEDSLLLEKAVFLSKHCGSGFSQWNGYWQDTIAVENSCTKEISDIFQILRNHQKKLNPVNYYLSVPFDNLSKAIFKNSLYKKDTSVRKFASILFLYRTVLFLLGLLGIFLMARKKNYYYIMLLSFVVLLYVTLCWGGSPQMRNIEIRYFLHADILLLFSAAFFINWLYEKVLQKIRII